MERLTSNDLVMDKDIQETLKKDKGQSVSLTSWRFCDFTKKGDNYASIVTSIITNYDIYGKNESVTYVVKTNPCRENATLEPYTKFQFRKEGGFYTELSDKLSEALKEVRENELRVPRCFLVRLSPKREIMILEDLRSRGFVMESNRKGLSRDHAILVIRELARLHSASIIYKTNKVPWVELAKKHPYLRKDRMNYDEDAGEKFYGMYSLILENALEVLKKVGGYDKAVKWLVYVIENLMELYEKQLAYTPKFTVICHGDCWTNNLLFRYNTDHNPEEVILLDLQMCRIASLTTDLNYFLYSSLDRLVRHEHLTDILSVYYNTFRSVLAGAGITVPFEFPELLHEFKEKNLFGAITAFTIVPATLMPQDEILDYSDIKSGGLRELMKLWQEKLLKMVDTNPLMKPRFIELFDELEECGLICVE